MNQKLNEFMDKIMWDYRGIVGITLFSAMTITMIVFVYMTIQLGGI